jgi:hypothetical protein
MRTTNYFGIGLGAIVVEKRKGFASSVKIVRVDRHPPEGAAWLAKWTTVCEITDRAEVRRLDNELHAARRLYRGNFDELSLYDDVAATGLPISGAA